MKLNKLRTEQIGLLQPDELREYLRTHDWTCYHTYPNNDGSVWVKDNEHVRLLHDSSKYVDYPEITTQLVLTVCKVDNLTLEQFFIKLYEKDTDYLKFRFEESDIRNGTILLSNALQKIQHIGQLLTSIAASVDDIRKGSQVKLIYPNRKSETVINYGQNVRLGQTEVGSYVITVAIDVEPRKDDITTTLYPSEPSFARDVNITLARSLIALNTAYDTLENTPDPEKPSDIIAATNNVGVNVNVCEELAKLGTSDNNIYSPLKIDFDWSAKYPVPEDIPQNVTIKPEQLRHYAKTVALHRATDPTENITITGVVTDLSGKVTKDTGTITVNTNIDGKMVNAEIVLPARELNSDYNKALEAHRARFNGTLIQCTGTLVKTGQGYQLVNPKNIMIITPEKHVVPFSQAHLDKF